jgi:hypothetical protein
MAWAPEGPPTHIHTYGRCADSRGTAAAACAVCWLQCTYCCTVSRFKPWEGNSLQRLLWQRFSLPRLYRQQLQAVARHLRMSRRWLRCLLCWLISVACRAPMSGHIHMHCLHRLRMLCYCSPGGHDPSWRALKAVELYDPVQDSWKLGPMLPSALPFAGAGVATKGQVYIIGGGEHCAPLGPAASMLVAMHTRPGIFEPSTS